MVVLAELLHALDADAYHYDVEISMVAKRRSHLDDIAAAFLEDMRAALLAAPDATP